MFTINQHKGFQITFANGYTVSVQFGPGNYCDKKYEDFRAPAQTERWACGTAEVAVIRPDDTFVRLETYDTVAGYITPDEVAALIAVVVSNPESLAVPEPVFDDE